jgi:tape measure domain-containing protein
MSSISTAISITDRMTGPIQNIIGAVNSLISVTESAGMAIDGAFDIHSFDEARQGLDLAQRQMEEIIASTERARQGQDRYNDQIEAGQQAGKGLLSTVKSIAGAYLGIQGIQKLMNASDAYVQTEARLGFLVDDGGSVDQLEAEIMASANRARASYATTADAIAKLGIQASQAFSSNNELIAFTELLNKSFVNSGTSVEGVNSVMLQLTQSMAAGKLQGEELNAVLDNAAPIVQNIQKYLEDVMDIDASNIKELASEGAITAEIIKQSMFYAADEINAQFEDMPMTWGQVWNLMSNYATIALEPMLLAVSALANNMDIVAPIVLGIASAFAVYTLFTNGATWATNALKAAQMALKAASALNPVGLVIIALIALISLIYAGVAAYNKFTDSSVSATGIIGGAFGVLAAFIGNQLIFLWNMFASVANFVANVFIDPVGAVKVLFYEMAQTVLGFMSTMAHGVEDVINKIPGVEVDITSGLDSFLSEIEAAANEAKSEADWFEFIGTKDYMDFSDAANTGYTTGENLGNSIGEYFGGIGNEFNIPPYDEEIASSAAETAENTGTIADEIETTKENMEYLRKMAERDVVLRYMTPNINVDMSGMSNSIKNGMDIDGVIDHMVRKTNEAAAVVAEGA